MTELTTLLKSWRKKLLLMVGGVIAGLLIIETFTISTGFAVPPLKADMERFFYEFMQPDAQLGFKPKPNLRNFELVFNSRQTSEVDDTDSYGFRNLGRDYTQSNLYFVGDSFTWGFGISREKAFYGLIESELKQPVITLGISGYAFAQYEVLFRDWVAKYKPKTAVFCVYANDLRRSDMLTTLYQRLQQRSSYSLPWYKKTFLYQFVFKPKPLLTYKKASNGLALIGISGKPILAQKYPHSSMLPGADMDYLTSDSPIKVEAALSRIIGLTKQNQIKLFVFLIPSKESTYIKDYTKLFPENIKYLENEEMGYERLCKLAKAKDITCVDLTEAFRQKSEWEKLYFDIDPHWNSAGHKLAAQLILDTLVQEGGVDLTTPITAASVNRQPGQV